MSGHIPLTPHVVAPVVRGLLDCTCVGPAAFPGWIKAQCTHTSAPTLPHLTRNVLCGAFHLLQLRLGAALPDWIQAQCTYAKLKKDEEGKWVLQVLKQKIWYDSVSYELQEIYGMEATRTAAGTPAAADDIDGRECVICMSAPRNTTVLPCRHMCICDACADELRNRSSKCPICREPMESLLHIKQ